LYEKLPERVKQDFFLKVAKEHELRKLKKEGIFKTENDITDQQIIDDYAYNPHHCKVIATEAINKAIAFIDKYVATREDLCYLGSFRKQIALPSAQRGRGEGALVEEDEEGGVRSMNLFMCVKYKNAGKLSSHNWFFNGFCRELNPSYTVLMDVGLKPEKESIFKMYRHMKEHPSVGGVCGYMRLKIEQLEDEEEIGDEEVDWLSGFTLNFVDIQKAQQMEYNLAHIIDKPFESAFRFIHVLPGAFSGYNMKALESEGEDKRGKLLKEYFRSIEEKLV
jgi:chitin synthase